LAPEPHVAGHFIVIATTPTITKIFGFFLLSTSLIVAQFQSSRKPRMYESTWCTKKAVSKLEASAVQQTQDSGNGCSLSAFFAKVAVMQLFGTFLQLADHRPRWWCGYRSSGPIIGTENQQCVGRSYSILAELYWLHVFKITNNPQWLDTIKPAEMPFRAISCKVRWINTKEVNKATFEAKTITLVRQIITMQCPDATIQIAGFQNATGA
jgi:hypothetical protein